MTSPRKNRVGVFGRRASGRRRRPLRQVAPLASGCSVRSYETASGRTFFCNADPIGFAGGLNHYAAFGNNPISFIDPFGLKDQKAAMEGGMMARFVVTATRTAADFAATARSQGVWLYDGFIGRPMGVLSQAHDDLVNLTSDPLLRRVVEIAPTLAMMFGGEAIAAMRAASLESLAGTTAGRVLTAEGGLNTSATVARQLAVGGERSWIPTQSIVETVRTGTRVADPQGVAGQFMYRSPFSFTRSGVGRTGSVTSQGTLEVLVHEPTGQIRHVLYRSGGTP